VARRPGCDGAAMRAAEMNNATGLTETFTVYVVCVS
jgi:hypothetical protein